MKRWRGEPPGTDARAAGISTPPCSALGSVARRLQLCCAALASPWSKTAFMAQGANQGARRRSLLLPVSGTAEDLQKYGFVARSPRGARAAST